MTNKREAIEAINAEPYLCSGSLVDPDGNHCALGAMLRACGVDDETLEDCDQFTLDTALEAYGLTDDEIGNIMWKNDLAKPQERAAAVIAFIESL